MSGKLWRIAILLFTLCLVSHTQTSTQKRTLVINGHSGDVTIYLIEGRSFVDLETLARIGNGSLSFRGNQIVLSFGAEPIAEQKPSAELSTDFRAAAVQDLKILKEWRQFIAYGLQRGVPGDGSRLVLNRNNAAEGLELARTAASTPSDQNALQLLTTYFNSVDNWFTDMVNARKRMDTGNYAMTPDGITKSSAYQALEACGNFLSTMISSGSFSDDGSCVPYAR